MNIFDSSLCKIWEGLLDKIIKNCVEWKAEGENELNIEKKVHKT